MSVLKADRSHYDAWKRAYSTTKSAIVAQTVVRGFSNERLALVLSALSAHSFVVYLGTQTLYLGKSYDVAASMYNQSVAAAHRMDRLCDENASPDSLSH